MRELDCPRAATLSYRRVSQGLQIEITLLPQVPDGWGLVKRYAVRKQSSGAAEHHHVGQH